MDHWHERIPSGGSEAGGVEGDPYDLRPVYHGLAAAYGWTYAQIDAHTLAEANELFDGWREAPPVHILVRGIYLGLGGKLAGAERIASSASDEYTVDNLPSELRNRPGLPILRGRDPDLPKAPPVFDLDAMRQKNLLRLVARARAKKVKA